MNGGMELLTATSEQQPSPVDRSQRAAQLHELNVLPLLLGVRDLGRLFSIGRSQVHKLAKSGAFDVFKVHPAIGPRCYSRVLVARYLLREPLYVPTFGKKRA